MAIDIKIKNSPLKAKFPLEIKFRDRSGLNVEITLLIGGMPPIHQAFLFASGGATMEIPAPPGNGTVMGTIIMNAFWHEKVMSRSYDLQMKIGNVLVASAKGAIDKTSTFSVGFGDFAIDRS